MGNYRAISLISRIGKCWYLLFKEVVTWEISQKVSFRVDKHANLSSDSQDKTQQGKP